MKKPSLVRFEIFKRDKFTCQYCGRRAPQVELELEHICPLSKGGTWDMWNLVTACHDCNQGKAARPLTIEQIRMIDGHIPNLVAQIVAHADLPGVIDRLIAISVHGRLVGDWLVDLEALLDEVNVEGWAAWRAENKEA